MNFSFIYNYDDKLQMGEILAHSIRFNHPKSTIIQISSAHQKKLQNVDIVERHEFKKNSLMHDYIKSQKEVIIKYGPTVFLDADMIILKPLDDFFIIPGYEFSLTERPSYLKQSLINPNVTIHREKYPEIINKKWGTVMPFNAGIYFCKNPKFIDFLLSVFPQMLPNYYQWYGDQIALRELVRKHKNKIKILDGNIYNYSPKSANEDFSLKKVLHFKGSRKSFLFEVANLFYKL